MPYARLRIAQALMRGVYLCKALLQIRLCLISCIVRLIRMNLGGQLVKTLLQHVGIEPRASGEI